MLPIVWAVFRTLGSAFRSPWQNGTAERWVGCCRQEPLDHVVVLGERHLRRLLRKYVAYHHEDRTHCGLGKDTPSGRGVEARPSADAKVVALPRVAGLHHRYVWRDAAQVGPVSAQPGAPIGSKCARRSGSGQQPAVRCPYGACPAHPDTVLGRGMLLGTSPDGVVARDQLWLHAAGGFQGDDTGQRDGALPDIDEVLDRLLEPEASVAAGQLLDERGGHGEAAVVVGQANQLATLLVRPVHDREEPHLCARVATRPRHREVAVEREQVPEGR
ncbi:MAG: transposase [Armatimonadetes bacterium]|nr:transposase [Armatimonadota bacterium]